MTTSNRCLSFDAFALGKNQVAKTLGVIGVNRGFIRYLSESDSELTKILEFHIHFGNLKIHGTDILRFNENNQIVELSISMRPLPVICELFDLMHTKFKDAGIEVAKSID